MTSLRAPETDTAELEPERLSSLEEAGPDWDRLAQASENIFATTTWIDCWSRHTADIPKRPYYWTCRRADGSVAAILPLVLTAGRYVRKLRFAGFGAGWRLGPICAREDLEPACAALRRVLSETGREWDIFVAEDLPGEGWAARLQGRHLYRLPCPVVRFEWKDWDEYLDSRPRRTRHELRRLARRAEERGLVFRTIDCEQELPGVFDTLVEQHLKRWGDHASPWFVGRLELHRDFTREALRRGWLRLLVAEEGEEIIAVSLGYRFGLSELSYQASRKIAVDTSGMGLIIRAEQLKRALADGIRDHCLGPGGQDEKTRFANYDPGLETVAVVRTLRGRVAARRINTPEEG